MVAPSERFRKKQRLQKQRQFDQVLRSGYGAADSMLVVTGCPNRLEWSRLGVMVSRRVGPAVVRNRWKRWIREAFRRQLGQLPAGLDLVVRPRRGAVGSYAAVASSLKSLAWQVARRCERGEKRTWRQASNSRPTHLPTHRTSRRSEHGSSSEPSS